MTVALLLDTHALIWWLLDDVNLSPTARDALATPESRVFVSSASIAEIAIKLSIHKLPLPKALDGDLLEVVTATGFTPLPGDVGACLCHPTPAVAPSRSV